MFITRQLTLSGGGAHCPARAHAGHGGAHSPTRQLKGFTENDRMNMCIRDFIIGYFNYERACRILY